MPIVDQSGQKLFTPQEAADMLGVSVGMLRYLRRDGRIEGTELGNITFYTEEQIRNADTSRRKRGPKEKDNQADGEQRKHHRFHTQAQPLEYVA